MSENIEIEVFENDSEQTSQIQLPMNIQQVGVIEGDDLKVYIKQDVYSALEKYAVADVEHERGTIILGDYCEELGKGHVVITNYIEARYTDASASTLTFTHETWDYVHKEHDSKYPDKKIVGWQHTHPDYGIFLSNYDLFIHENFFNLPFQVAYVIDPVRNIRGFFQWKNGKIEKLQGFYIFDDVGKKIKIQEKKSAEPQSYEQGKKPKKSIVVLSVLLCLITVAFGITTFSLIGKYNELETQQNRTKAEISKQDLTIEKQSKTISNLEELLLNDTSEKEGKSSAETLLEKIEKNEIKLNNQSKTIKELKKIIQNSKSSDTEVKFISYTVKPGDTLTSICEKNNIEYDKIQNTVLAINNIQNANSIYVGQQIVLPITTS